MMDLFFLHAQDSGIGSGIDSFFEYLLKSYTLFGSTKYATMFSTV